MYTHVCVCVCGCVINCQTIANIDLNIYHFCCSSFLIFQCSRFPSSIISFIPEEILAIILGAYLLVMNFLSFSSSENVFTSSSFQKDIFTGYKIYHLTALFFSVIFKYVVQVPSSMVSGEKFLIIN